MAKGGGKVVIVKKIKKGGHGHHGGSWKVAYADFVTAMMAFFLLMWLINTTSPEQKRGIADYFAPASVSQTNSGAGGILGGSALGADGSKSAGASDVIEELSPTSRNPNDGNSKDGGKGKTAAELAADAETEAQQKAEAAAFASAAQSLRQALQDMPELAELSKNIIIDETPEGLRIQLVDQEGRAMFQGSSADPLPRTQHLLETVAKVIQQLPNRISISGHTDTTAPSRSGYSNWDLSADRANAARRILEKAGVESDRIFQVAGKGDREPLYPDDPDLPANRRISITLMPEAPVMPSDYL